MAERESRLKKPSRRSREDQPAEPLAIVGIGVCAASLRSLLSLFSALGSDPGVSYVIAVRQQDGLAVDMVVEALGKQTDLPVKAAAQGERIEPDRIYVGGGSELITLTDGHVAIRPAKEPAGHRGTVDSMLISLAEHA
ncbi:MAG TPA: chemotaxis protein CheB, partial [Sphingomicrobium sp.]